MAKRRGVMGSAVAVCEQPNCGEKVVWLESGPNRLVLVNANSVRDDELRWTRAYRPGVHVPHSETCAQGALFTEALDTERR